jgi:hypothetical protein
VIRVVKKKNRQEIFFIEVDGGERRVMVKPAYV